MKSYLFCAIDSASEVIRKSSSVWIFCYPEIAFQATFVSNLKKSPSSKSEGRSSKLSLKKELIRIIRNSKFEFEIGIWNLNLYANVPTLYTVPILDASFWEEKSQENDSFLGKKARNSLQTTYVRTDGHENRKSWIFERRTDLGPEVTTLMSDIPYVVFLDIYSMYFQ